MEHSDPLMVGMFWAGLLVAAVPILLTVGVGIYVLRRYLQSRREEAESLEERRIPGV
jgi:uncharacterized protein (DUF2062 family)